MEVKNLDNDYLEHSNNEVFTIVKYLTSAQDDKDLNALSCLLCISTSINHITDIELLFSTVRLLKNANLLCEYDDVFSELNNSVFKELQYSENDIVRILSFVVSGLLEHEIYSKILSELGITDFESFKYGIERREVQILNLSDLRNKIKKVSVKGVIKNAENLNPMDREKYLYKIVSHLQTLKYDNETSYFDNEIEHFDSYLKRFNSINDIRDSTLSKNDSEKLSLRQIALFYIYEMKLINSSNSNSIAKDHGHTSGSKLVQHYNKYRLTNDRIGTETSKQLSTNKLDLIISIIPLLKDENKVRANDEINLLSNNIERDFV